MADDGLGNIVNQLKRYIDFSRRLFRRWWVIVICTALGIGISVALALSLPRVYQSRTLISWKGGSSIFAPEEDSHEENWLQNRVEEMVSSHTTLLKIAQDLDLYPGERAVVAPEQILEYMKASIKFDTVGADTFWIAFEYSQPRRTQQVTTRLAREFIQQNVREKVRTAMVTQSFMESEVNKSKAQMDTIESELAQFVSAHPEFQVDPGTGLPRGGRSASRQASGFTYVSVKNPALQRALSRKGQLEAQLQLLESPQADPRLVQAREDLASAQRLLAAKRRQYTDEHPDVLRVLAQVRQASATLRQVEQRSRSTALPASQLREELAELDQSIAGISQVKRRPGQRPAPAPRAAAPGDHGLNAMAKLEKRWYGLTRDREVTRAKYEQLQERLTKARVTANLEKRRAESQFAIVDPANLPGKPIRPSRVKIVLAGTFLGGLLGLALAFLLVLLDPRIYGEDDLRRICDLPLLAQIPRE